MRRILVTEDSSTMRSLLVSTIESCGDYEVVEAASGFEALRLLPREKVDLIITDINMPDINGLELIGFVKSNPAYRDIPLIIVSTEKTEEDKRRGMALGAMGYVVKPFRKEDLLVLVKKAVGGDR
jgi:two-component system chemotaxis response regulator CheY